MLSLPRVVEPGAFEAVETSVLAVFMSAIA
jgi:hypothetical protein